MRLSIYFKIMHLYFCVMDEETQNVSRKRKRQRRAPKLNPKNTACPHSLPQKVGAYNYRAGNVSLIIYIRKCASECQSNDLPTIRTITLGLLRNVTKWHLYFALQDNRILGSTTTKKPCGISMRNNVQKIGVHLPLRTPCLHIDSSSVSSARTAADGSASTDNCVLIVNGSVEQKRSVFSKP
jgi:hypothetical protein